MLQQTDGEHPAPASDLHVPTFPLPLRRRAAVMAKLLAIKYSRGQLHLLDQRLLPFESTYLPIATPQAAFDAIRSMVVRGAPAIGCTAALAVAAWLVDQGAGIQYSSAGAAADAVQHAMDHLIDRRAFSRDCRNGHRCTSYSHMDAQLLRGTLGWRTEARKRACMRTPIAPCINGGCGVIRESFEFAVFPDTFTIYMNRRIETRHGHVQTECRNTQKHVLTRIPK